MEDGGPATHLQTAALLLISTQAVGENQDCPEQTSFVYVCLRRYLTCWFLPKAGLSSRRPRWGLIRLLAPSLCRLHPPVNHPGSPDCSPCGGPGRACPASRASSPQCPPAPHTRSVTQLGPSTAGRGRTFPPGRQRKTSRILHRQESQGTEIQAVRAPGMCSFRHSANICQHVLQSPHAGFLLINRQARS